MTTDILTLEQEFALLLDTPAKPPIGRESRPMKGSELAPVINKYPETENERLTRVLQMKRAGYLVPVNESIEFLEYAEDDAFQAEQDAYDIFESINWGV